MDYQQTEFFPLIEPGYQTVTVSVQQVGDSRWLAMIANGWWQAYGKNKADAIKKVVQRYIDD